MKFFVFLISLVCFLLCGCFSSQRIPTNQELHEKVELSWTQVYEDWTEYVVKMKHAGDLIGFSADEHGDLRTMPMELSENKVRYPCELTAYVIKNTETNAIYWYFFQKEDEFSPWKLQCAWKTDRTGIKHTTLFSECLDDESIRTKGTGLEGNKGGQPPNKGNSPRRK